MRKYTKKEIKKTINAGIAKDITDYSFSELKEWRNGQIIIQNICQEDSSKGWLLHVLWL